MSGGAMGTEEVVTGNDNFVWRRSADLTTDIDIGRSEAGVGRDARYHQYPTAPITTSTTVRIK